MFEHFHRDGLNDIELHRLRIEEELKTALSNKGAQGLLFEQYSDMVKGIIENLRLGKRDPEAVFQNGLGALKRIEQFRFLLENLIEAVKRDESLNNSLRQYDSLGFFDFKFVDLSEEKRNSPWLSNPGSGRVLRRLWDSLRTVAFTVMDIVANAIKAVPKFVSIKPKPTIGFSGPFPTFSLQFDLEADSMTIHELFHVLKGSEAFNI